MATSSDSESCHAESNTGSLEECRNVGDSAVGNTNGAQEVSELTEERQQQQLEGGRTADSVRSSLSNFRQSASRTTGQIRELLETSKALDRDLVTFLQDPQTRAFLESVEDYDDDDNNLMDMVDEGSSDNPKEVEALKQKTKSLKRKLRKWRKAARMALSEICPDLTADAQGDMTPGTMKSVLQKIRQLKSLTERQTSIIMTLTGQCEDQRAESAQKDGLIIELLKNCNGIRPTLTSENQQETIASGASSIEGMVTKHETIDYQLISAAEVEEVLNQTGIQFGSAHLIPTQLQRESVANTVCSELTADESNVSEAIHPNENENSEQEARGRISAENIPYPIDPSSSSDIVTRSMTKSRNVWLGLAVGVAAGLGRIFVGNLNRRSQNSNN